MSVQVVFFDLGDTLVTVNPKAWVRNAKLLLAKLVQQGFRLGIISNTGNLPDRVAILAILPTDFDLNVFEPGLVLFSSEVGFAKPDPNIFKMAVSQSGVAANRCLYCSENIVETLVAQHVGMMGLRIQPPPGNDLDELAQRIAEFHAQI